MASSGTAELLEKVKALSSAVRGHAPPPESTAPSYEQPVIFLSLVSGTRGYLESLVHQINGTYEHGWYDACAVMIRRLVETLIIEAFEAHGIDSKIKNSHGDFLYLKDLIDKTLAESVWNLSRNTKQCIRSLKDIGDKSAHSRRFVAHRRDVDGVIGDLRVVVQELVYLAKLK